MARKKKRYANLLHDDQESFVKRVATVAEGAHDARANSDLPSKHAAPAIEAQILTREETLELKRLYMAAKRAKQKAYEAKRLAIRNERHRANRAVIVEESSDAGESTEMEDAVEAALRDLEIVSTNRRVDEFVFPKLKSEWIYTEADACQTLELFQTADGRGIGVRTTAPIPKIAFIIEYVGELVGDIRYHHSADRSYMFELRGMAMHEGRKTEVYIDPLYVGNWARFINHHCEANCAAYSVADGYTRRVAIIAYKDIEAGEELTYAYSKSKEYFKNFFTCNCGADKCITKRKKYLGFPIR